MDAQDEIPLPPPPGWLEALEQGRADAAAGRSVPIETVLAELQASLDRMDGLPPVKKPDAA